MNAPAPKGPVGPRAGADALLAEVYVRAGLFQAGAARGLLARLEVAPEDRLLELGFGSGRLLAQVAARASHGHVAGVEPSLAMLRHAARRNARLVAAGRVALRQGSSRDLSDFAEASFDGVYGVHVPCFWDEPTRDLAEIARVLRPGGRLVLGYWPEETPPPCIRVAELEARLGEAGFGAVRTERERDEPVGVLAFTCARGPGGA